MRSYRSNVNDLYSRQGHDLRPEYVLRPPHRYTHFANAGRQMAFREEEDVESRDAQPDDVTTTSGSYVVDLRDVDDSERHLPDICEDIIV